MATTDTRKPRPHCSWCGLKIVVQKSRDNHWFMPNGIIRDDMAYHVECHEQMIDEDKFYNQKKT